MMFIYLERKLDIYLEQTQNDNNETKLSISFAKCYLLFCHISSRKRAQIDKLILFNRYILNM